MGVVLGGVYCCIYELCWCMVLCMMMLVVRLM